MDICFIQASGMTTDVKKKEKKLLKKLTTTNILGGSAIAAATFLYKETITWKSKNSQLI
ncbi:hypothetical protein [Clostridium sp. UBA7339]|uniref:hypothetical protein n=1 Tax=Clostridium sp. UBA7339 TaxID=1946376 RepID=UPI0032167E75